MDATILHFGLFENPRCALFREVPAAGGLVGH